MLELIGNEGLPEGLSGSALAIGKFDSLHLGHQQIMHELVEIADQSMLASVVVSFDRHPNAVLKPDQVPLPIIGPGQKKKLLTELGVDFMRVLAFDAELAALKPAEFVERHLLPLRPKFVLVGGGFRFGSGGMGIIEDLREMGRKFGFSAREVPNVMLGEQKISTSAIRKLLESGNVAAANLLLGRNHVTEGIVEHGRKLGRQLGFPTANISRDAEGYLPADGVYAGYLHADGVKYPAAHSVGTNDSIAAVPRLLESHVIGRDDLDLYGKHVVCEYVDQVRPWAKFDSVAALTEQIARDVARASELMQR